MLVMYGWRMLPSVGGLNGSLAKALDVFRDHGGCLCPSLSVPLPVRLVLSAPICAYVNDMTAGLCHETISLSSYRRLCVGADSCNRLPSSGTSETPHVLSNAHSFSSHIVHISPVLPLTPIELFNSSRPVSPIFLCSLYLHLSRPIGLFIFICLSIYLSINLSYIYLSCSFLLSLSLFLCLSVCLSLFLCHCLSRSLSLSLSFSLTVSLYTCSQASSAFLDDPILHQQPHFHHACVS